MYSKFVTEIASHKTRIDESSFYAHKLHFDYGDDLPQLLHKLLADESGSQEVEDAQWVILTVVHLQLRPLLRLGRNEAHDVLNRHRSIIKAICQPRLMTSEWLVMINDIGHEDLTHYFANFTNLTVEHNDNIYDELEAFSAESREVLASCGLKRIAQGYTFEFINFAAIVALNSGTESPLFEDFMSEAKRNPLHFYGAMAQAIGKDCRNGYTVRASRAAGIIWQQIDSELGGGVSASMLKEQLACTYRNANVPPHVFAADRTFREELLEMDLGL